MSDQIFADGIATISVIQGTVRVDLMVYSATATDGSGQPLAEFRQRIIMGREAFLATAEKFQEAARRLGEQKTLPEPVPAARRPFP